MESLFTHLLAETRAVHDATPPLREFADWPDDLVFERPLPREIPALPTIKAMAGKGALYAALAAVCPHASWVQTYSEAEVGRHFLDHYGHIELFGPAGIFRTQACRAFIGYWGPGLFYPMHDHEAEEIYLVLTGRCLFEAEGDAPADLGPGGVKFHRSGQSHAMTMGDEGMLALCLWRGAGLADNAKLNAPPASS